MKKIIQLSSRSRIKIIQDFAQFTYLEYRIKWLFWHIWVTVGDSTLDNLSDAIQSIKNTRIQKKLAKKYSGFYEYRFFLKDN